MDGKPERRMNVSDGKHEYSNVGVTVFDQAKCSCGWVGSNFWDGSDLAYAEWEKHVRMDGQPTTMPEREPQVERYEDMSPDGRLRLIQQEDGDVIVVIVPPSEQRAPMMAVEFCTFAGGGQSPHTR